MAFHSYRKHHFNFLEKFNPNSIKYLRNIFKPPFLST